MGRERIFDKLYPSPYKAHCEVMGDAPEGGRGWGLPGLDGQYVCIDIFSKFSKMDRLEAVTELIRGLDVDESIAFVNLMDGRLTNSSNENKTDTEKSQEDTEDDSKLASSVLKSYSDRDRHEDINYSEDLRDDGKYACGWEDCGKILESKNQYRWHDYAYHKAGNEKRKQITKTSCETCGAVVSSYQLSRHIRNVHGKNFTCEYCRKRFSQESLLTSHIALHSEETFFSCSQCGKKYKHLKSVKRCEKGHKCESVKYTCHLCTYTTQRKDHFDRHVNSHLNRKSYKCHICEYKASNKLSFKHHIEKKHDASNENRLLSFPKVAIHLDIKGKNNVLIGKFKHSCPLCEFNTQRKDHLNYHVNVHLDIRPFSCLICEFKTFEKRDLKNHVQKRHVTGETSLSQLEHTYPFLYKPSRPLDGWRNDSLQ